MLSSQEQARLSGAVQAKINFASLSTKVCIWATAAPCPPKGKSREKKGLEEMGPQVLLLPEGWEVSEEIVLTPLSLPAANAPSHIALPPCTAIAAVSLAFQGSGTVIREGNDHSSITICCPTKLPSHLEMTITNKASLRYCFGWISIWKSSKKVCIIFITFNLNHEGKVFQTFVNIFSQN